VRRGLRERVAPHALDGGPPMLELSAVLRVSDVRKELIGA